MDWVASRQIHSKKVLEKELGEIEAKQRITEAKRLKQIRDLGVDLSKLQKTSRDLDEIIDDIIPRRQDRRCSLPALSSSGAVSYQLEEPKSPRSKRRLSSLAAFPGREPPDSPGEGIDRSSEEMTLDKQRRGSNPGLGFRRGSKTETLANNAAMRSEKQNYESGRRSSSDNGLNGASQSHNTTEMYVHSDDASGGAQSPSSSSQSMFGEFKRQIRRSSEPAVGGHYIRVLQDKLFSDGPPLDLAEAEEVKKSIRKYLPSDIVAERDEDELEEEEEEKREAAQRQTATTADIDVSSSKEKLSSISEGDQDGGTTTAGQSKDKRMSGDKATAASNKKKESDKSSFNAARQRRRSEGDVLKFAKAWRLRADAKISSAGRRDNNAPAYGNALDEHSEADEIWDAVRKCRYIRGYEPPEMKEPEDIGEFVFGHRNKDAHPPGK